MQVRWSRQKDFFVENLFHHECEDYEAARAHYHFGIKNKIMVSTATRPIGCLSRRAVILRVWFIGVQKALVFVLVTIHPIDTPRLLIA